MRTAPFAFIVSALAATVLVAGCGGAANFDPPKLPSGTALSLYEGLPHQRFEKELLEKERAKKLIVEFQFDYSVMPGYTPGPTAYPFYKTPLQLKPDDAHQIRDLLANRSTYNEHTGGKACGGFHPDYAIEWSEGGKTLRALLCFGCSEIILLGGGEDRLFDNGNSGEFEAILKSYRRNRPESSL